MVVAPLDATQIAHVYEVRGAIDALAARLAAERRAALDPALVEEGRRAARGTDVKAMIEADIAFHSAIYEASGNPLIGESARPHWVRLRRVMGASLHIRVAARGDLGRARGDRRGHRRRRGRARRRLIGRHAHHASDSLRTRLAAVMTTTLP